MLDMTLVNGISTKV